MNRALIAAVAVVLAGAASALAAPARTTAFGPAISGEVGFELAQGVAANMEVGTPTFPHGNSYVDEYVGLTRYSPDHFFRAGIQWQSGGGDGQLYVSKDGVVTTYGSVQQSDYRNVRVRNYDGNNAVIAEWFTGGQWQTIATWSVMSCSPCEIEIATKIIDSLCQPGNAHTTCPAENAPAYGGGFTYVSAQYRNGPGDWRRWTSAFAAIPEWTEPYFYCQSPYPGQVKPESFRTPRDAC